MFVDAETEEFKVAQILSTGKEIMNVFFTNVMHNWTYLAAGVILAAAVQAFAPTDKVSRLFRASPLLSIVLATAAGAFTPLCSCGTVAVILGLVASGVPWPPIVAFLVSSPLMSPSTYVLMAGSLGTPFANAELFASIAMALAAGLISMWMEKISLRKPRTASAAGTVSGAAGTSGCCCAAVENAAQTASTSAEAVCGCSDSGGATAAPVDLRASSRRFASEIVKQGVFILKWFLLFDLIGSALSVLVPSSLVQAILGQDRWYSVPLAALAGVPLYVSETAAIPLMGQLVGAGMSKGAALAFMISGPGTSMGAMAAVLAVAPKRVFWLYVGAVLAGALAFGYAYGWLF